MNMHARSASFADQPDTAPAESEDLPPDPVFIFMDTETTGFRATDEIVEICLMRVPMERAMDVHFEQLTLRLCPVSNTEFPHATAVHGLTYEKHLQNRVTFQAAADSICSFICQSLDDGRPTIIVCHNVNFDRRMLGDELARIGWGYPPELQFACTLEMMRAARKSGRLPVDSCSLGTVYKHVVGREMNGAHGAFSDTLSMLHIVQTLARERPEWQGDACPFKELARQAATRAYSVESTGY